jgi:hypothetical protein
MCRVNSSQNQQGSADGMSCIELMLDSEPPLPRIAALAAGRLGPIMLVCPDPHELMLAATVTM